MRVRLLSHTNYPDEICQEAAAICTASDKPARALRGAVSCGHESVLEHASFTFRIEGVSRVLLAQLTRHRIASFSVESQRYVENSGQSVIVPPSIAADPELAAAYEALCGRSAIFYERCLEKGVLAEDARYGFLQGGRTQLIMTMNARELRHFFSLRCCNRAQWEIREMADQMFRLCRDAAPALFRDAGCACMAGKPCPEGKQSCGHPRTAEEVLNHA